MIDTKAIYKVVFPALGGLNTAAHPTIISDQQLSIADNIVLVSSGSRETRYGQSRLNTSALNGGAQITHIVDYIKSDGSQQTVVKAGSKYYADNAGDGIFSDITGSEVIGANSIISTAIINNILVIFSDGENPYKYNQSGNIAVLGGSPPAGKYCRYYLGRLWVAGVAATPHRLYYSQAFDPEQWVTGAGYLEIDPDDGDPKGITAIFPGFQGELYIAKWNKLYKITGSTPALFQIKPVSMQIGCVAHNSIAGMQDDIIFASERGIMSLKTAQAVRGEAQSTFLSAAIHNQYQLINKSRLKNIVGIFVPQLNSYLFGCSINTTVDNNIIFGFNIIINEWFRWTNYKGNALAMILDASDRPRLANGTSDGYVNRYNEDYESSPHSDYGNPITMKIQTPVYYINNRPHESVDFSGVWITARSNQDVTLNIDYKIDNQGIQTTSTSLDVTGSELGEFRLGTDLLGGTGTLVPYYAPLAGMGHGIQLTMYVTSLTARTQIFGYEIKARVASESYEVRG